MRLQLWVSDRNSVARKCAKLCATVLKFLADYRARKSQLRASKIHLRWKPYLQLIGDKKKPWTYSEYFLSICYLLHYLNI